MPADIYALGMVILEVLTGCQPFHEKSWKGFEIYEFVGRGERPTKPDNAELIGFGDGLWELMEECWAQEPGGRPTIERVSNYLARIAMSSIIVDPTLEMLQGGSRDYPIGKVPYISD
jgi:hypothetical protein